MAVVDLSDVQTPGAGGDQGGFLQWLQGLAPGAQSAIMRVMAQANPVSSANAATADSVSRAPNPLNNPSPVPPALAGGGPSVPVGAVPPMGTPPIGGGPGMTMDPKGFAAFQGGGGSSGGGGASNHMPWPDTGQGAGSPIALGGGPGNASEVPTGTPAAPVHPAVARAVARARINPRATALAPGAVPPGGLLHYYAPTTGNARGSTWSPYTDPNDPRIFRGGPLAAP